MPGTPPPPRGMVHQAGAASLDRSMTAGLETAWNPRRAPSTSVGSAVRWRGLASRGPCRPGWSRGRALGMLRITAHGLEEASDPQALALQGSQGDRRCRAAGRGAGGAHRERASEGHRAGRFRHRCLGPQQRPHRWARCPQHPGHDQEQDGVGGVKRSAGAEPPGDAEKLSALPSVASVSRSAFGLGDTTGRFRSRHAPGTLAGDGC
jgi:hypothetical protein